ncbi:TPA: protein SciX, partial [Salmonella enterica subsp. enterica serovar Saintpaul]
DEDNEQIYVYNVPLNSLPEIIENCRYFEYYVADHELSWLICENDHGDLIVCSTIK